ncbi:hypothetical protein ACQPW1_18675 [Nocardia sp. CA-128927]|uniref:hypothetical protein n=1 Tax=Nocardia sp. CA-128927 TaxID=3239975 RepID=UPI003D95DF98
MLRPFMGVAAALILVCGGMVAFGYQGYVGHSEQGERTIPSGPRLPVYVQPLPTK